MSYLIPILIALIIAAPISWLWVRGIDNMKKNHPNYKGEDFLNWDRKNDGWDKINDDWENKNHTEGDFH